jgi:hypothetical protein
MACSVASNDLRGITEQLNRMLSHEKFEPDFKNGNRCTICLVQIGIFQDGRCVMCGNTNVCADCVQYCAAEYTGSLTPAGWFGDVAPFALIWSQLDAAHVERPVVCGDRICFQCGVFSKFSPYASSSTIITLRPL